MKIKFYLGLFLSVFVLMSATCQDDPDDVTDKRDNIVGSWHANIDDGAVNEDYVVEISKDEADATKIKMTNFFNKGGVTVATITGYNLTVAEQSIEGYTVFADGTISESYQEITWNITIDGDVYTCSFVPGGITKNSDL